MNRSAPKNLPVAAFLKEEPLVHGIVTGYQNEGKKVTLDINGHSEVEYVDEAVPLGGAWPELQGVKPSDYEFRPRVHPNGFLQLDLSEKYARRLHVWDKRLPRQVVRATIHSHEFDFRSHVLKGILCHTVYDLREAGTKTQGTYDVWEVERQANTPQTSLTPTGKRVTAEPRSSHYYPAEEVYNFDAGHFHATSAPRSAVTVMKRGPMHDLLRAQVLVPSGQRTDEFVREAVDAAFLWKIIADALLDT